MSTNSQFTTAVHILTLLAGADGPMSSTWIAGSVNTHPVVIRQIIGQLRDAGLVETVPGCAGGAVLKKDPAHITLADVYQLVKEDMLFGLHPNEPNPHCPVGRNIQEVLVEIFGRMDELIVGALAQVSIADVRSQVSCKEMDRLERSQA